LPVPGIPAAAVPDPEEPEYCCFGCKIAADAARESAVDGDIGKTCLRLGLSIFLSLNVMIFTMWLWTHDVYGSAGGRPDERAADVLWSVCRYACLVFSLPVLWMLGLPLAEGAWRSARRGVPTTDVLLIAGTAAAYVYSVVSTLRGSGAVYFEVGCAVLVLVTLGRWLEARGKQRATAALDSMEKLLPSEVRLCEGSETRLVPLDAVRIGDRLRVCAGERVPVDGRIVRGTASIDSQILTGESRPTVVEAGDSVIGGTLNLDGDLTIQASEPPHGGTWRRLLDCLRSARQTKGRHQQLADRAAAWFLPLVAVVAATTFAVHGLTGGIDRGLLAALAVVLVACPCALGLATPLAVWASLGTAARAQVLFRNGESLERLAGVRAAAFDKTGTLTDGRPVVERFEIAEGDSSEEVSARTAGIVAGSTHDLSRAIGEYLRVRQVGATPEAAVRTLAGRGVEATFHGNPVVAYLGSVRLMRERESEFPPALLEAVDRAAAAGMPLACVGWGGRVRGLFAFREHFRPAAESAVRAVQAAGLCVEVLTGDHARRGMETARRLGVVVRAELLPEDKVAAVGELRRTVGPTLLVGDGINDAPALAAADVGMALGCGADVSRQTADVCLLGDDLTRVAWSIELARQTVTVIRQNLFWSFAYNVAGIALAATGRLNPVWAAAAMAAGGISVVANSLRLTAFPPPAPSGTTHARVSPANPTHSDSLSESTP
jgi:heavy metal translocating P-type ATPase